MLIKEKSEMPIHEVLTIQGKQGEIKWILKYYKIF